MVSTSVAEAALREIPVDSWPGYLRANSGLPGARGNLELANGFAHCADRATILQYADLHDEYQRFCGTQALGRLVVEDPQDARLLELIRVRASDDLWRVREAASRALQLVGDADPALLRSIVAEWITDENPYVRRAALAAICEPRLLTMAVMQEEALRLCQVATESILVLSEEQRRAPAVRTLRQALGYCWSVAVAANPQAGMPVFDELRAVDDPDVQWIVSSNLMKGRMRRLLLDARR